MRHLEPEVALTGDEDKAVARLQETLRAIEACLDDAADLVSFGKARFDEDWTLKRAAKNIVAELAEAVGRLPQSFKQSRPQVPWRAIISTRNRVVHDYENVDFEVIWATFVIDLPELRRYLHQET
jgi:uncharacterized protein with HEPN domain